MKDMDIYALWVVFRSNVKIHQTIFYPQTDYNGPKISCFFPYFMVGNSNSDN